MAPNKQNICYLNELSYSFYLLIQWQTKQKRKKDTEKLCFLIVSQSFCLTKLQKTNLIIQFSIDHFAVYLPNASSVAFIIQFHRSV